MIADQFYIAPTLEVSTCLAAAKIKDLTADSMAGIHKML